MGKVVDCTNETTSASYQNVGAFKAETNIHLLHFERIKTRF